MSNWYYVDTSGQTKGPVDEAELKRAYGAKTMTDSSYVWNGTTVNDWTPLSGVPSLLAKLKPKPKPAPSRGGGGGGGGGMPRRKSPFGGGGGGMAGLLGDIRKGKTLKKAEPAASAAADKPKPVPKGGGRALTMQEQMAAVLARRRGGGGGGGGGGGAGAARGGGGARPSPVKKSPAVSSQPKSPRGSSAPKKFGGSSAPRSGGSSSGGPSVSAMKSKIKGKLDRAEEWQLKAIAKILDCY